ncbi:MAG: MATE family efflux transporter [Sphaerochaetaceae bacterium]|jgi:putative MATE family efflux protein
MQKQSHLRSVNAQIIRLSLPTMVGMLLQALYDLVDLFWIGFISPAAVAASTLFNTFFWIVEVLNEIVGTSSVSLISQSHGAQEYDRRDRISEQTLFFKFLLALIGSALLALMLPLLFDFFTNDPLVKQYGLEYGIIRIIFLPFFFSSYSVNTIFRCTDDAKTPMILMIISAVMNMIADPLLMFDTIPGTSIRGLGWGMRGAAIATVGSISFAFLVGFILLLRGKSGVKINLRRLVTLDLHISKQLFSIGLPSGINLLLRNLSMLLFMKMVSLYGTQVIAISGIAMRIYSFAFMPGWGLGMGSGIVVGHSIGEGEIERAKKAVLMTTIDCVIIVGLFATPIMIFPSPVLSLFLGGVEVGSTASQLMRMIGPALLVSSLMSGMGAAFMGSGQNKPLLKSSMIGQWGVLVPVAIVVSVILKAPVIWLWSSLVLAEMAELVSRYYYYKKIDWEHAKIDQKHVTQQ